MKAIATVSMYDMGAANRNGLRHSQTLEQRKQIVAEAAAQRYIEFKGGETKYTSGTTHELTADTHPIQREFYDFIVLHAENIRLKAHRESLQLTQRSQVMSNF